jgi:hypothetical protein
MSLEALAQERRIGDVNYRMNPVPFGIGRQLLMRLVAIVSPMIAGAMRAAQFADGGKTTLLSPESYAAIFDALPSALTDADVKRFAEEFGKASWFQDGDNMVPLLTAKQDDHFAGRYLEAVEWLAFGLEVNFAGFFAGVRSGKLGSLLKTVSPSTSSSGNG